MNRRWPAIGIVAVVLGSALGFAHAEEGPGGFVEDRDPPRKASKPVAPPRVPEPRPAIPSATTSCVATTTVDEGIVEATLKDKSWANQSMPFSLGPFASKATFDASGRAVLKAPLLAETGELVWTLPSGTACRQDVTFANFRNAFVFAILWVEPAEIALNLDLHAVEPGSAVGAASGYLAHRRPVGDASTLGVWHEFGVAEPGAVRVQSYAVPSSRSLAGGIFTFRVEFSSRGEPAAPPFCKGYPHERASYRVYQIAHGNVRVSNASFGARECMSYFDDPVQSFARFEMRP